MFVSIVIPTFNRIDELLITIPQIEKYMDDESELIIFDQSTAYSPDDYKVEISNLLIGRNFSYYHASKPSVPLAWNTTSTFAKGDLLLFLDDDIDLHDNILEAHRELYRANGGIVGVAGSYYASSFDKKWVPSSSGRRANTLAGVHASFLRVKFVDHGAASEFVKPFAGFDWEIAEYFNCNVGPVIADGEAFVFHRAPAKGGCENQGVRGDDWYRGCYYNHSLWFFSRKFPYSILKLPRHVYSIVKYCIPKNSQVSKRKLLAELILPSLKAAWAERKNGVERFSTLTAEEFRRVM